MSWNFCTFAPYLGIMRFLDSSQRGKHCARICGYGRFAFLVICPLSGAWYINSGSV